MKKIFFALLLTLFINTSCTSVLDKEPLDMISDGVLWKEPALIDKYLQECYGEMGFFCEEPFGANQQDVSSNLCMGMLGISDEATSDWVQTPKSHWINIGGGIEEWWAYSLIRKLNIFIEKLSASTAVAQDVIKQRTAEARFLRAFCYFNMVKRYGGVPLIKKSLELNDSEEQLYPVRAKEEEVYQFIIDEINDIFNNKLLPESYSASDVGRPTIWAALALKSRAAMYAASIATWGDIALNGVVGIDSSKASNFWQQSLDASNYIINKGPFSLFKAEFKNGDYDAISKNYRDIFMIKDNCEVIFAEKYNGKSGRGHSWDMWENPASYNAWAGGQCYTVYLEFAESYENIDGSDPHLDRNLIKNYHLWTLDEMWGNKDPRFKASIYTQGTPWTNAGARVYLDYHRGVYEGNGNWVYDGVSKYGFLAQGRCAAPGRVSAMGILKYLNEAEAMVPEREYSDTDWIVFRLAEIYLNKAEAAFELGYIDEALSALNIIRERAGMPFIKSSDFTRDKIRHERKIELAFEGNRYWDLRRWRIAEKELTKSWSGLHYAIDGASAVKDASGNLDVTKSKYYIYVDPDITGSPAPYFLKQHYYFPITQSRTNANPNLVENPYYQ